MTTTLLRFVPLAALIALAGCGGVTPRDLPKTAPVTGSATHNGKARVGLRATFHPQFEIGGTKYAVTGTTDRIGKFTVGTGGIGPGAPPGEYVVTFDWPRIDTDRKHSGLEVEMDDLKGKYSDPAKSQFKVTIKDGDNALDPFRLD